MTQSFTRNFVEYIFVDFCMAKQWGEKIETVTDVLKLWFSLIIERQNCYVNDAMVSEHCH